MTRHQEKVVCSYVGYTIYLFRDDDAMSKRRKTGGMTDHFRSVMVPVQ